MLIAGSPNSRPGPTHSIGMPQHKVLGKDTQILYFIDQEKNVVPVEI
jgi:hypothetical protein